MNKKILIVIAIAIIAALGAWLYYGRMNAVPAPIDQPIELNDDTTESINEALDEIDVGDIDEELSDIDEAIQGL